MKYLKKFPSHEGYSAYSASTVYLTPNVSLCDQEDEVHYGSNSEPPTPPVVHVDSVSVSPTSVTLNVGATTALTATVLPSDATDKSVTWSSSDETIATVNASGVITAIAVGNATITVTTVDGGKTAQCAATIEAQPQPTNFIAYTATSQLNADLTAFTPAAISETYDSTTHTGVIGFNGPVTAIGDSAFLNKGALTSIDIPSSVTSIGSAAFANCSGLTSIDIPTGITSINFATFSNCSRLTSIDIPSGVTSIGNSAFVQCSGLTSIVIPDSVTSIGVVAFAQCSSLTSINIPSGVTSIGDNAFTECSGLTSIDIPDSVTSIGIGTFGDCTSLASCTIGSGVTSIGSNTFEDCTSLTSVNIPSGVTSIGNNAFTGCTSLTSIDIPSGVTSIGNKAFDNCTSFTSITCEATTPPTLGIDVFVNTNNCPIYVPCESLEAYESAWSAYASRIECVTPHDYVDLGLPSGTKWATMNIGATSETEYGKYYQYGKGAAQYAATSGQSDYTGTENPLATSADTVAQVWGGQWHMPTKTQFEELTANTTYEWTTINGVNGGKFTSQNGNYVFFAAAGCWYNGSQYDVGSYGYYWSSSPNDSRSAYLLGFDDGGKGVSYDSRKYGYSVRGVKSDSPQPTSTITYTAANKLNVNLTAFSPAATAETYDSATHTGVIEFNDLVNGIGVNAFGMKYDLMSIELPNSITTIGYGAFGGCTGLTSITIPDSVTDIGAATFMNCPSLTSISIPSGVTNINNYIFEDCTGLLSIDIPSGVTSIGHRAFLNCSSLTSVTVNAVTPPTLGDYAFDNTNNCPIYVPCESVNSYKSAWSNYSSRIQCVTPPQPTTAITYTAANKLNVDLAAFTPAATAETFTDGVGKIEFANGVTAIGNTAFFNKNTLTSIDIPNGVTSIGNSAFFGCSGLTSIDIPSSVTSIDIGAFGGCNSITSVTVDSNNTVYDSRNNCNGIIETSSNTLVQGFNNTVIPDSVTSIGDFAFLCCTGLTSIYILSGITAISSSSFRQCTNITSITVDSNNTAYDSRNNCNVIIDTSTDTLVLGCNNTVIPSDVTSIGDYAFYQCNITSVTIPDSVTSIGENAFGSCSITSLTIPSGVTSIGSMAFNWCNHLASVTVNATTPATLASDSFANTSNCPIYVPCESVDAYKAAAGWSGYSDRIQCIEPTPIIYEITVTPSAGKVMKGEEVIFTANVNSSIPSASAVTWNFEDCHLVGTTGNSIAVVYNEDSTTDIMWVTATSVYDESVYDYGTVSIYRAIEHLSIYVYEETHNLNEGTVVNCEMYVAPSEDMWAEECCVNSVEWFSSDSSIATVDNGQVTIQKRPEGVGSVDITCKISDCYGEYVSDPITFTWDDESADPFEP